MVIFHTAINYDNQTLRLVDQTLQTQDVCSLRPRLTSYGHAGTFGYSLYYHLYPKRTAEPIFIFNCPLAVNNSSRFLEIGGCKSSRYTYLKMGEMNASEVSDGCGAQFIGLTSWPNIKDHVHNNISLSDFHQAILYGFELYYWNPRFGGRISVIELIRYVIRVINDEVLPSVFARYLEAKFVIGRPFIIAFLVIKFRRI